MANIITLSALLTICCILSSVHYAKSAPAALQVTIHHLESESLVRATPSQVTADGATGGQYVIHFHCLHACHIVTVISL